MTAITYETFKENFGDYKLEHLEGGVHPEYFYVAFYDEFIQPVVSSLFSEEDKKKWVVMLFITNICTRMLNLV